MFNIKQLVNRITENRSDSRDGGEPSASFVEHEEQHSAEGFLCPPCMKAFPSPEALEEHYKKTHESESGSPDSNGEQQLLRQEIKLLVDSLQEEKANTEELRKEMLRMKADMNAKEVDASSVRSQEFEDSKSLLSSEVALLRQQLADSLEQVSSLRKDKETWVTKAEKSLIENDELKKEIVSLQTQLAHRNSIDDAEVLRQELVSIQKLMDQLSMEKEKEIEALNNKLNQVQEPAASEKENFLEQLAQANEELKVLKEKATQDNQRHEEEILRFSQELGQKNFKLTKLESDLEEQRKTLTKEKEILQTQCEQLQDNCERVRVQYAEVCSKIETGEGAKAALEGLQEENAVLKKDLEATQNQNRELSKRNHDLGLEIEKMTAEMGSLKGEVTKKDKECEIVKATMGETVTSMQKELDKLSGSIQNYSKQVQQLESELSVVKGDKAQLQKREQEIVKKLEIVSAEKVEKEKQALVQAGALEKMKEELQVAKSSLEDKETQLKAKTEGLSEASIKISVLEESLSSKEKQLQDNEDKHKNQLIVLNTRLNELQTSFDDKSEELRICKQTMETELASLRTQLTSVKDELTVKNDELSEQKISLDTLTASYKEKEETLQVLQSKVDEIIQHKLQLEQTCESNEEEKSQLLEKLISYESETKTLNAAIEELTRKRDDAMAALQELGRENQSLQIEIAKIQGRKWADDSNVSNCSSCTKEFTLTFRKHHCRHCGQIFCSDCSSKSASVPSSKKPVRVCDGCFVKLTTQ